MAKIKHTKAKTLTLPPVTLPFALKDGDCEDDATLIHQAVDAAHLPPDKKPKLNNLLQTSQVCTLRLGRTDVLQHHIYTHHQISIKQRPYRMSPSM